MAGSSTSSSTRMLPVLLLLLPLFISTQQSSTTKPSTSCKRLSEFNTFVDGLKKEVKNYWENCNSATTTNGRCQCINITVSPGGCSHLDYFIQGLSSLNPCVNSIYNHSLTRKLETMKVCKRNLTALSLECDRDVISPITFINQLVTLKERLNNLLHNSTP